MRAAALVAPRADAPLYPPFYLLTAAAMLAALIANRLAIALWWARPPSVGAPIVERLRFSLSLLLPVHWAVALAACIRASPQRQLAETAITPFAVSGSLWLVYMLAPFRVCTSWFEYDPLDETSDGIRYDEVVVQKGYEIERYRGMAARRADDTAGDLEKRFERTGIDGELGGVAGMRLRKHAIAAYESALGEHDPWTQMFRMQTAQGGGGGGGGVAGLLNGWLSAGGERSPGAARRPWQRSLSASTSSWNLLENVGRALVGQPAKPLARGRSAPQLMPQPSEGSVFGAPTERGAPAPTVAPAPEMAPDTSAEAGMANDEAMAGPPFASSSRSGSHRTAPEQPKAQVNPFAVCLEA